ncbi:MAG: hypothetical protein AABO57_15915 [Acidobacteriota bacterium]
MNKTDFVSALQEFGDGCNTTIIPAGTDSFELQLRDAPSSRRMFLKMETEPNGKDVAEVLYRCLCGIVTDPNALPHILSKNFGGVMGTEFFFSGREMEGNFCLFLETRAYLDPASEDKDEVTGLMVNFMMSPLFTMEWDFPQGVRNFLW